MGVRRGLAVALALLMTVLVAGACGGPDAKTRTLTDKLEDTHLTLYEISLRDARPASTKVNSDGAVEVRYDRTNGYASFTLVIGPAKYDPTACARFRKSGAQCSWRGGVLRSTFEEMSTVWVDRGKVRLGLGGLVTESDPTLLEDAVKALQKAKVVDAATVAAY
jgi:hypothetical protein